MCEIKESASVLLSDEFARRKENNNAYSVRAFANYLEVDASSLSKVLKKTRLPSETILRAAENKLNFIVPEPAKPLTDNDIVYMTKREFEVISEWEYFATLDLVTLDNFKFDYDWMSSQLGITAQRMEEVVERLCILGFLGLESNTLVKTNKVFSNDISDKTNEARKEYQKQLIHRAAMAIDHCEPHEKDITSMTIAADPKRMEIARNMIKNFRRELCAFLEEGDKTEVMHLTVQLCPANLSKKQEEHQCVGH